MIVDEKQELKEKKAAEEHRSITRKKITENMKLSEYASNDATSFTGSINPAKKKEVLSKAKQPAGAILSGTGSLKYYERKDLAATAIELCKTGRGVCHQFAQLTAYYLLQQMENGTLPRVDIKMVAYKNHTFLLVNHEGDDLTDLSKCLILDPWAEVMGYSDTHSIFTYIDYPYQEMLKPLICVFDSSKDVEHQELLGQKSEMQPASRPSPELDKHPVDQREFTKKDSSKVRASARGHFSHSKSSEGSIDTKKNRKQAVLTFATDLFDEKNKFMSEKIMKENKGKLLENIMDQIYQDKLTPEAGLLFILDIALTSPDNIKFENEENCFSWSRHSGDKAKENFLENLISKNSSYKEEIFKILNLFVTGKEEKFVFDPRAKFTMAAISSKLLDVVTRTSYIASEESKLMKKQ